MSWFKKFISVGEERPQGSSFGFHVLKNTTEELAIEPWFDFICGINGRLIDDGNPYLFIQEVQNCAGRDVPLTIWSAKGQKTREMMVKIPADKPTLGLTMQWCPLNATEDIWHILEVSAMSPADSAGLLPYSDYIIGTPEGILRGESALGELIEAHMDRPLRLYVYNHEYDVTRELSITPTRTWGGEGALGCMLGYGALHRLPNPLNEPVNGPGETLFEAGGSSSDFQPSPIFPPTEPSNLITPAAMANPPMASPTSAFQPGMNNAFRGASPTAHLRGAGTPPPRQSSTPPVASARQHKSRHAHHVDLLAMDDYMREGEQKSKELDRGSTPTGAKGLPPPPKRSQPPPVAVATPPPPPRKNEDDID